VFPEIELCVVIGKRCRGLSRAELVSYLSQACTLEPGDLIATGNPDHPHFQVALHPGDRLEAEIEGIGALHVGVVSQ